MSRSVAARVTPKRDDEYNEHFPTNRVQNSYPSLLIFIPISVVRQYSKPLSFYFLVICALAFIREISPYEPMAQLIPVVIVLSVSVFRECIQERYRQKDDYRVNSQTTRINREGKWVETRWADVAVGDVILIPSDSPCPADIVMVASSAPGNSTYIQTTNLDGESSFKPRYGIDQAVVSLDMMTAPELPTGMKQRPEIIIHAEAPRTDLDWFQADAVFHLSTDSSIEVDTYEEEPDSPNSSHPPDLVPASPRSLVGKSNSMKMQPIEVCKLSIKNFIPREAVVRGTEWVVGVVVYTGKDTKVLLGQQKPAYKVSKIDRITNHLVLLIVFFQVTIAALVAAGAFTQSYTPRWWLFPGENGRDGNAAWVAVVAFLSCGMLITSMIPISLVVSLEIAKIYQAKLMELDSSIPGTKTPSQALNDDLGQVGYILSDKTGTLTTNELVLKVATIGGVSYPDLHAVRDADSEEVSMFIDALSVCHDIAPNWSADLAASAATKRSSIWDMKKVSSEERTVRSGASTPGAELGSGMSYCGESPDEICLVTACATSLGKTLTKRSHSSMTVMDPGGMTRRWGIVRFNAFDNGRRRSSIIVSKPELGDDKFILFVKGSDDAVLPSCVCSDDVRKATEASLTAYAKESLRTLVFAYKYVTRSELAKLDSVHASKHAAWLNALESGLTLLGCSGTEDKLQDGLEGSIHRLRVAGIAVWMITGDKLDTAVEISKSANLISPGMECVVIDIDDAVKFVEPASSPIGDDAEESPLASEKLSTFSSATDVNWDQVALYRTQLETALAQSDQVAAVITGRSIRHFIDDPGTVYALLRCRSVVVCRSTKDQKAMMVKLIQTSVKREVLVLAIGDGANDVPMIKQADVGVGIAGKEGRQACQNADYVITKFGHLERILLFHGRLNYVRTSKMVLYFLFKNLVLTFPFALHAIISSLYSSSMLVTNSISLSFNTLLTSVPVFAIGLMERDVSPDDKLVGIMSISASELARCYPKLYMTGRQNRMFTKSLLGSVFVGAVFAGTWAYMSALITTSTVFSSTADGKVLDHWCTAQVYFVAIFVVDTAAAVLISEGLTVPMVISVVYSVVICLTFLISDAYDPGNPAGSCLWEMLMNCATFAPILILCGLPPVMTGFALKACRYRFNPTARMIWQEAKEMADIRRKIVKKIARGSPARSKALTDRHVGILAQPGSIMYNPDDLETAYLVKKEKMH